MAGGDAGCPFDVIVEAVHRHAEPAGVEAELMLAAEKLVDQRAQLRNGGIGRPQGNRAGARTACGEPRDANRNQRQQSARRHPVAFAAKTAFLEQLRAECGKPGLLRLVGNRNDRMGCERAQPRYRLARAIGKRDGCILRERDHPPFGVRRIEPEAVRHRGRHDDRRRGGKRQPRGFERHFAAAAFNQ